MNRFWVIMPGISGKDQWSLCFSLWSLASHLFKCHWKERQQLRMVIWGWNILFDSSWGQLTRVLWRFRVCSASFGSHISFCFPLVEHVGKPSTVYSTCMIQKLSLAARYCEFKEAVLLWSCVMVVIFWLQCCAFAVFGKHFLYEMTYIGNEKWFWWEAVILQCSQSY